MSRTLAMPTNIQKRAMQYTDVVSRINNLFGGNFQDIPESTLIYVATHAERIQALSVQFIMHTAQVIHILAGMDTRHMMKYLDGIDVDPIIEAMFEGSEITSGYKCPKCNHNSVIKGEATTRSLDEGGSIKSLCTNQACKYKETES